MFAGPDVYSGMVIGLGVSEVSLVSGAQGWALDAQECLGHHLCSVGLWYQEN